TFVGTTVLEGVDLLVMGFEQRDRGFVGEDEACALRRDFVETGNAETSSRHSFGSFGDQGEGARTMLFFDARDAGPRIDLRVLLRFGETLREALPLCRIIYDLVANIVNPYAF